jgi:N-acetylglucosaminyl-diphospho-decaprenol L-rhamnosyltransferase
LVIVDRMVSDSPPRLDVVIVNRNGGPRLERCLASLTRASRSNFELDRVVVVDNASQPAFAPKGSEPWCAGLTLVVISNTENVGFAAACNQGAFGSRADYVLFLNPDTQVEEDALAAAIDAMESDADGWPCTGIVGLPLVDTRGERQATCGHFPNATRIFNQVTGLTLLAPARFHGCRMMEWDHADTRQVDYVSGACLMIRRRLFDDLHGFDARFKLYLEDADLALRARRLGWDAMFLAGPEVFHESGWHTGTDRRLRLAHASRAGRRRGDRGDGVRPRAAGPRRAGDCASIAAGTGDQRPRLPAAVAVCLSGHAGQQTAAGRCYNVRFAGATINPGSKSAAGHTRFGRKRADIQA